MPEIKISTNRKTQIATELQNASIPVSDEAISAVIRIIKDTPKCSVSNAVAIYKASVTSQYQQTVKEPQKASGQFNELLAGYSDEMRKNLKKQVVKNAILGAIEDFKNGDFSDCLDDEVIGELNAAMNIEYRFIELGDLSPKYLPSSSDTLQLLPSAIEVESAAIQE